MFLSSVARRVVARPQGFALRFFHASPIALEKLNVKGLAEKVDLKGQNVLVRVDLNVPLAKVSSNDVMVTIHCKCL